ncbi:PAS domain-containing protein [Aromatoleum toluvorans]|uniref:PAS domain-containing protein n=1 Tax=Aromatoleum toluvorans TaxID=92002 RepID=A0ABX1Q379_9RHOO|nr:PAS domain-containing protein [Aromatoleum toluvorans]NMG46173.1 PAS domain-containing protein [Aromatoleum toluvorans]
MLMRVLPPDIDTLLRYGDFLSGLEVGILAHAPDGVIEYANDTARSRLGFRSLAGLGLDSTWDLLDADGGHLALSELPAVKALCLGRAVTGAVVGCLVGGELHLLRMDALPVPAPDGSIARVVTAFRDVTPPARMPEAVSGVSAADHVTGLVANQA